MSPPAARGPQTPPYAYRVDLDDTNDRVARAEERLEAVERAHGIDTAALIDKLDEHEARDSERHDAIVEQIESMARRLNATEIAAAVARALAERQPSQAEAVLIEEKRDELAAAKERRAHLWAGARRVGAWLLGGGGMAVLGAAAVRACGGG